jgi:Pentapeptide repeats (8 copies)
MAASVGSAVVMMGLTAGAAAVADSCQPGSGPNLAGKQLTNSTLSRYDPSGLRCSNLTGADLSGLSLVQFDFTGANLSKANLQHADLSQAMLIDADLSGANLTDATMIQVTANDAKLVGANLSGVDLTQADLTDADLSKANLSGASFTQATLDHTTFTGATGLLPWNLFVLAFALLMIVALLFGTLRRTFSGRSAGFGYSNQTGINPGVAMVRGLLGAIVVGIGFSLAIGGFLGEVLSAAGPPVAQTCVGALCKVGVSSGFIGIFGGVFVIIAGFALRASSRRTPGAAPRQWSGGFSGPFN